MARISLARAALAAAVLAAPGAALACRCAERTPAALVRAADAIVAVEVERTAPDRPHFAEYAVRTLRGWKGSAPERFVVRSRQTSCKVALERGRRFLLFLKRGLAGWETSRCSGTAPLDESGAALRLLGGGR